MTTVPDPFELVETRAGYPMERWRANAMLIGETGALLQVRRQARADAVSAFDELEQRERTVAEREARCDQHERELAATAARLDSELDRAAEQWDGIEQARADQEEEPLAHPPDQPADPAPGTDADDPPLHSIRATENPDPVEPDAGPPPPSVPLSYVHSRDQAGFPSGEQPHPPVVQQPIAAGLD